ncbi:hypothetical protein HMPREF1419_01334 [Helicobacter pylori GAM263BFi]|nr:hypothetical protein HMPREF1419_01334 [Helicobacter pylori GAM263BFi]
MFNGVWYGISVFFVPKERFIVPFREPLLYAFKVIASIDIGSTIS